MTSGTITFNLCNCHVYDNHVDIYNEHRKEFYNNTFNLPTLNLDVDADVFNFTHDMASLDNYEHGPKVSFPIAV
jgi:thymidylate synthase